MNNIKYPTFKECLDRYGSNYMNLTDFSNAIINDSNIIPPIILNSEYCNIATFSPLSSTKFKLYEEFASKMDKPFNFYSFSKESFNTILGDIPNIINIINISGSFDYLFLNSNDKYEILGEIFDKLKCQIVYFDDDTPLFLKKLKVFSYIEEKYKLYPYQQYLHDKKEEINEVDIKIEQILPFINENLSVFSAISNVLPIFINTNRVNITLNSDKFNILVLCATTTSIQKQKYKNVIKMTLGNVHYNDSDVYYLGVNINKESYPYISRCVFTNFHLNENSSKFNLIISEYCPFSVIYENSNHISNLLSDSGTVISPKYSSIANPKKFEEFFTTLAGDVKSNFSIYVRNEKTFKNSEKC